MRSVASSPRCPRKRQAVWALVVVVGISLGIVPGTAQAEAPVATPGEIGPAPRSLPNCGENKRQFALVQKETYDTTLYGVKADIQRKDVALCSPGGGGSPDFVSTWNMLIPRLPATQYAQAGWIRIGTESSYDISGYHTFSEFTKVCNPNCAGGPGGQIVFSYGPDPVDTKNYQSYLRSSDDRIVMRVDSTVLGIFNRDVTGEWSPDWSGQWASETHVVGSDVPGTATDKLRMYNIQRIGGQGAVSNIASFSNEYAQDSRHHILVDNADSSTGGKRIRIWTDPLS